MKAWLRVFAATTVVAMLAVPALAQVTPGDVAEAEARLAELRAEADELAVRYEAALAGWAQLDDQVSSLELAVQDSQVQLASTRRVVRERAVEMYMESSTPRLVLLLVGDRDIEAGIGYLEELSASDSRLLADLGVIKAEYERQLEELETARSEQDATLRELELVAAQLEARLETAQDTYVALVVQREAEERARLEEEARRRAEEARLATSTTTTEATTTTASATTSTTIEPTTTSTETTTSTTEATSTTVQSTTTTDATTTTVEVTTTTSETTTTTTAQPSSGRRCPVDGFSTFTDTWGAPRSGGRTHQGVDMLAARGTPVVAIETGAVERMRNGGLGGITVWLRGTGGDEFYYAHLDAWADGLSVGAEVEAGGLLGYVGSSGNASELVPHLHFEFHPGGGPAVNPYPLVDSLCR